ncbi:hypothetical protein GCM10007937_52130 [Mesorhizobium albiziae]|nr:hypothetical protein GCM10007937_52130 [Mesorhizobium albiziae]
MLMVEEALFADATERPVAGVLLGDVILPGDGGHLLSSSGGGALLYVGSGPIHKIASSRSAAGDGSIPTRATRASQSGCRSSHLTTASTSEAWKLKAGL